MTLEELRAAVRADGTQSTCKLDAGVFLVTETISVSRSGIQIAGAGKGLTTLVRGTLGDGTLFKGPLIGVAGQRDVRLQDFSMDGGRFERSTSAIVDLRHPLNPDTAAAEFPCARVLPAPECYDPRHFGSDVQAELLLGDSRAVQIESLVVRNSMTVGIAIGPGCREICLARVQLDRCGQFGLWAGAALHTRPAIPLPAEIFERLPSAIKVADCTFTRCGSSGAFLEARDVSIESCTFDTNHIDFPFNESGGQLIIDYKSQDVTVRQCRFEGSAFARRSVGHPSPKPQEFGAVGIEASGERLKFIDNVVKGVAREAIHINGARTVEISGKRTCFEGNHQAPPGAWPQASATQNISVTTTSEMAHLGAMAGDITISGVRCENGIVIWSNGSVPGLKVDRVRVLDNDLTGPGGGGGGVSIGANPDGSSVGGLGWEMDA